MANAPLACAALASSRVQRSGQFHLFDLFSIGQELVGCLIGVGVVVLGLVLLVYFVLSVTDFSF